MDHITVPEFEITANDFNAYHEIPDGAGRDETPLPRVHAFDRHVISLTFGQGKYEQN